MAFLQRLRRLGKFFACRLELRQDMPDLFDRQSEPRTAVYSCGRCRLKFTSYALLSQHLRDCGKAA